MPMYAYQCPSCSKRFDAFKTIANYREAEACTCGAIAEKRIVAPTILGDFQPYDCPITGRTISGRQEHKENLARHGCRVKEAGETEQYQRRVKQDEASFERSVDATMDQAIAELPVQKKDRLVAEMQGGITAEVVRK